MPHVLNALIAFAAEHHRCGDLDGGTDTGYVWMQCSCGGLIMQPEKGWWRRSLRLRRGRAGHESPGVS